MFHYPGYVAINILRVVKYSVNVDLFHYSKLFLGSHDMLHCRDLGDIDTVSETNVNSNF